MSSIFRHIRRLILKDWLFLEIFQKLRFSKNLKWPFVEIFQNRTFSKFLKHVEIKLEHLVKIDRLLREVKKLENIIANDEISDVNYFLFYRIIITQFYANKLLASALVKNMLLIIFNENSNKLPFSVFWLKN